MKSFNYTNKMCRFLKMGDSGTKRPRFYMTLPLRRNILPLHYTTLIAWFWTCPLALPSCIWQLLVKNFCVEPEISLSMTMNPCLKVAQLLVFIGEFLYVDL
jgi:hypothetical protein